MKEIIEITIKTGREQEMLKFLKERGEDVENVISVKLDEFDSDYGFIGENYIVKCTVEVLSTYSNTTSGNKEISYIERTCLVDSSEFNRYLKKQNTVRWI